MLKILKQNAQELQIAATDQVMDSTIARTERMLQQQTMNLDLTFITFNNDTGYFEVHLENLAGHKFPSGYPSRRAFVEFLVIQDNGDTLFQSGVLQPDYEVAGQNATYEPHYNIIKQEDQVASSSPGVRYQFAGPLNISSCSIDPIVRTMIGKSSPARKKPH